MKTLDNQEERRKRMEPTDGDDVEERGAARHQNNKENNTREHHMRTVMECDVMRCCLLNNRCSMQRGRRMAGAFGG